MKRAVLFLSFIFFVGTAEAQSRHSLTVLKPFSVFKSFVTWYMVNRQIIDITYPIEMHPGDSTKPYKLNYQRLDFYINSLKKSNCFSKNFLSKRRIYYENIQSELLKAPQWDGFIPDHEFDDLFDTSELDIIGVNHLKFVLISENVKSDKASIICKISGYKFSAFFVKANGKWQIDKL